MLLVQCSFGPSAGEKAEAGTISRAIDQLREAPNAQKGELLDGLKRAPCTVHDLCQLQQLCVAGFTQHVAALHETARAKSLLSTAHDERGASEALSLASRGLAEAAPKIAQCADAQGAAHRKYKF